MMLPLTLKELEKQKRKNEAEICTLRAEEKRIVSKRLILEALEYDLESKMQLLYAEEG